jgi:hypothetical protein
VSGGVAWQPRQVNGDVSLAYQVVGEGPEDLLLVSGFLSNIEYAWLYPSLAGFDEPG